MAFIQLMCARIGMVTGRGLAGALRQRCPRWLLLIAVTALLVSNTITIGADLAGMSDAGQMLTGISSRVLTIIFAASIAGNDVLLVRPNRFCIEMAHPCSFRLRHHCIHCETQLGTRPLRHVHSIIAARTRWLAESRCSFGNNNQPVPLFLTSFSRDRRTESKGQANSGLARRCHEA